MRRAWVLAPTVFLVALAARAARADDWPVFEIAGKAGYLSNASTLGLGGRLGFTYRGFYGGLSLVDYLPLGTLLANTVVAEAEVGYGFKLRFVTLRPLLGIGYGSSDGATCPSTPAGQTVVCGTQGSFILQPGGLVQLTFGHVILGVDASALIPFAGGTGAMLAVDGQIGASF
jgi:hypothetical protein